MATRPTRLCVGLLKAALDAGARWIVLCDTNGGTLPSEVGRDHREVIARGIPGDQLGIHTHNDTENAVAEHLRPWMQVRGRCRAR